MDGSDHGLVATLNSTQAVLEGLLKTTYKIASGTESDHHCQHTAESDTPPWTENTLTNGRILKAVRDGSSSTIGRFNENTIVARC